MRSPDKLHLHEIVSRCSQTFNVTVSSAQKLSFRSRVSANTATRSSPLSPTVSCRLALEGRTKGLVARSKPMVVGTVGRPFERNSSISLQRASRSWLPGSTVSANFAFACGVLVRAVNHRIVGQRHEFFQAVPHHRRRAFEEAATA